jgi:hypothetical protein
MMRPWLTSTVWLATVRSRSIGMMVAPTIATTGAGLGSRITDGLDWAAGYRAGTSRDRDTTNRIGQPCIEVSLVGGNDKLDAPTEQIDGTLDAERDPSTLNGRARTLAPCPAPPISSWRSLNLRSST